MFKIKKDFILKEAAGMYLIVPLGENAAKFRKVMTLNETGAYLWEQLLNGCEEDVLADNMAKHYQISKEDAGSDLSVYLEHLRHLGVLEEVYGGR